MIVGGFSQGGAVALHVCLRSTEPLAGKSVFVFGQALVLQQALGVLRGSYFSEVFCSSEGCCLLKRL